MEAPLTNYNNDFYGKGLVEGLNASKNTELPSQPPSHYTLSKSKLPDDYKCTVFDKLKIQTNQRLNKGVLSKHIKEHDKLFCRNARKQSGRITVETNSNPFTLIPRNDSSIIELNPNKYHLHTKVIELLSSLIENFNPAEASVMDIHLNVDADLSFETVLGSTTIKFKRKGCTYFDSGKITGAYYGSRKNQLVIYDKAFEQHIDKQNITRFERRFSGNQCPFKKLSNISELKLFTPFDGIEFTLPMNIYPESLAEQLKFNGIKQITKEHGAQYTRRLLSSAGQFSRYAKYFQTAQPINLNQEYQKRLDLYLEDVT